jgi:hypothetical protein
VPISQIAARGVRGITSELTLDLSGKSFLLHGDNGTGKSSVERALRWVLLGEEEPNADPPYSSEASFRRNVSVAVDYPRVVVTFTDGSTITVTPGTLTMTGNGAAVREGCRSGWPFLRRSELLDVLASRPIDRFRYFESFLGLDAADRAIEEFSSLKAANESRRSQLATRITSALDPLAAYLPSAVPRPASAQELADAAGEWARQLKIILPEPSIGALEQAVRRAAAEGTSGDLLHRRSTLLRLRNEAEQIAATIQDGTLKKVDAMLTERAALLDEVAGASEADLLEHALVHFRRTEGELCPVCLQPVSWTQTRHRLQERSEALGRFQELNRHLDSVSSRVQQHLRGLDQLAGNLSVALDAGHNTFDLFANTPVIEALRQAAWHTRETGFANLTVAGGSAIEAALSLAAERARVLADEAAERLPTLEEVPQLQSLAALLAKAVAQLPQIQLLELERNGLAREVALQTTVLEALRHARQDVARDTLAAIQDKVAEYYFAIHPRGGLDDVTGAPFIQVQRHGSGTAFVRGEFGGQPVKDPKWVYSDGHLDTVGICIFLALRRHRAGMTHDPKLMVLDDIIISIDLRHARRLIDLLRTAFVDHQVIILTHNGLFAHWCKSLLPNMRRAQIKDWTLETGPRLGEYSTARGNLDVAIKGGTAKDIALALMALLDEWTGEARYAFSVAVAAKANEEYTLTEIWEPLAAKLRKIGKILASDLGGSIEMLATLKDVPAVRNQLGAHENAFAREYPRGVMVEIAHAACCLMDALYCAECQSFVTPIPNHYAPAMMHCPGHHKQYVAARPTATW